MMIYKNKDFTPLYFREDDVEIDHFRQPLLQFRSRSMIRVRISEIMDEMDFSQAAEEQIGQ